MNNSVLTDGTVVYYALAINNKVISQKFTEKFAAELERSKLPIHQQRLAELVTVDGAGRQLLLG